MIMYKRLLILGLFCLTIAISGAYFFARRLTLPLISLRRVADGIAEGDLTVRTEISTGDEVEDLAKSFNMMAENLQKSTIELTTANNQLKRDIIERKRTEVALHESEEKYRTLFADAGDALFILEVGPEERCWFIECNQRTLRLYGCKSNDIIGEGPEFFSPKTQPDGKSSMEKAIKLTRLVMEGQPQVFQWLHHRYDNREPFWVEVNLTRIKLGGKSNYMQAVVRDITERKKAEKTLRELSSFNKAILSAVPDIIAEVDYNKVYTWVNQAGFEFFGEDVLGKEAAFYFEGEQETYKIMQPLFEGDESVFYIESWQRRKDGEKRLLAWWSRVLKDENDNVTGALSTARDITERKKAEEALSESERRMRSILDSMFAFVGLFTLDGILIEVNRAPLEAASLKHADVIGKPFIDTYWWSHSTSVQAQIREALYNASRGETVRFDVSVRVEKDRLITIDVSFGPLYDSSGRIIQLVGSGVDITGRKMAEEKIKASLKEKEVLLQEIHHRVKNNMQIISSLLEFQTRNLEDKNLVRIFEESQNRINAMALIHDKLYQSENMANINFGEYIKNLANDLFRSYRMNESRVALKMDVSDVIIDIDSVVPCGLIVNELMTNSLKYAFPDNKKGEIKISLQKNEEAEIVLVFYDNGIGIPEDIDYRNADSLGLKLIFNLSDHQLGGKIELDRSSGTKFRITFKGEKYKKRI
jgi:PAS domain S-box-containing protein